MTKIRDLNILVTKRKKIIAIITIIVLTFAYVSLFNPKAEAQVLSTGTCELAGTVKVPLEVNVRTVANLFKTVIVEKEIFNCNLVPDNTDNNTNPDTAREITIVIEFFEDSAGNLINNNPSSLTNNLTKVEVIQCDKSLTKLTLQCTNPPLIISDNDIGTAFADILVAQDKTIVGNCQSAELDDPIAMDSATLDSPVKIQGKLLSTVKTVLVEKEILSCFPTSVSNGQPVNRIFDYFTIEEIVHKFTPTPGLREEHYGSVICEKHPTLGTVLGCYVQLR
jgi:hypothetical protein